MKAIRNVFRRKLRASLTISGITIGVFALVVLGAMAEKMNALVDGGNKYFGDKVMVSEAQSQAAFGMRPLSIRKVEEIRKVRGVAGAFAQIVMMLDPDQDIAMGMPKMLVAGDLGADKFEDKKWKISFMKSHPNAIAS